MSSSAASQTVAPHACHPQRRRLVVNADDFGRSSGINAAVVQAHQQGVLTTASLMVNEPACAEAVALARQCPRLGVGLHLTLLCGSAALPPESIPGLVDPSGRFTDRPVVAGWKYFFDRGLREALVAEIAAQVARFHATGLVLDHLNGHLHMHLHPVVFRILMQHAAQWGISRFRLTRDPFWLNARLARSHWLYRASHALIYQLLSAHAAHDLRTRGIRHPDRVFGLLQNARVDEDYLLRLLPVLPAGDSELYSHPSLDQFKPEFDALVSPRVRSALATYGINLIRYQDL